MKGSCAEPRYRPLLLTTYTLYAHYRQLLSDVRVPAQQPLMVVLPAESGRTRASLLAIAGRFQAHGGAVRLVEASRQSSDLRNLDDRTAQRVGTVR